MKIVCNTRDEFTKNSICAIGSFDGVHLGHQHIIHYIKQNAQPDQHIGIVTFLPLPFFVLKSAPIIYLSLKEEKEAIMAGLGIDFMYYFKFTRTFAQLSAETFVKRLASDVNPALVVVGENFHFGRGRQGSADKLTDIARGTFDVHVLPCLDREGTISSTRIRELLLLGHVRAANKLLGRAYAISGRVIKGKGKGAHLGFPTVNIKPDPKKLVPLAGVYEVRLSVDRKEYRGAMFCRDDILEVHILDFAGDLYGQIITIHFIVRIRDIEEFTTDMLLKKAITEDIKSIKEMKNV